MARRTSSRRFTRNKKSYAWTVSLIELEPATGTPVLEAIVADQTDWTGAAGTVGATMVSIRGNFMVRPFDNENHICRSRAILVKTDTDDIALTHLDPRVASTYVDESILWTATYAAKAEPSPGVVPAQLVQVDVKAKRRMNRGDNIRFVVSEEASALGTAWFGICRTLFELH